MNSVAIVCLLCSLCGISGLVNRFLKIITDTRLPSKYSNIFGRDDLRNVKKQIERNRLEAKVSNVLIIGASGRVGGSALQAIRQRFNRDQVKVTVGGRYYANWERYKNEKTLDGVIPDFLDVNFESLDIRNKKDLDRVIPNYDLIVHTAGPFQGLNSSEVLESALENGKFYLDVCDDISLSRLVRGSYYQNLAKQNNATAIISTGIWPGGSSLFAAELIESRCGGAANVDEVLFSFYTAGSGGAGPTILSATFLILGEDVITYKNGQEVLKKSATDGYTIDFGPGVGRREVARLNLIECESCHINGADTVQTFFGTSPPFWNTLFVLMAQLIPQSVLRNRGAMDVLARVSLPMVRLVDSFVGSKNSIRVDVKTKDGETVTGIMSHNDMQKAVGDSISAFARPFLVNLAVNENSNYHQEKEDRIPYGVFFPEEIESESFRTSILNEIKNDALFYSMDWNDQ